MEENKKRALSTPTKPLSKRFANFDTPVKLRQCLKEIHNDVYFEQVDAFNQVKDAQTIGATSQRENATVPDNRRVHAQAINSPTTLYKHEQFHNDMHRSASFLLLRTDCILFEEELLLYSLVCTSFPENGFNFKAKSPEKYDEIVHAIESVYHTCFRNHDLKNYFHRVTNNLVKGLGKVKGTVKWVYYKKMVTNILEKFQPLLKDMLTDIDSLSRDSIGELKGFISNQCLKARDCKERSVIDNAETVSESAPLIIDQIAELHVLKHFPKWKANYNDINKSAHLFLFSGNDGYAQVEVIIYSDKKWAIVLEGKLKHDVKLEWAGVPSNITSVSELQELLLVIQGSRICKGCPFEPFEDITPGENSQPVFFTMNKEAGAYVEINMSQFHKKVIRSSSCVVFLPGTDDLVCAKSICDFCAKTEHYMRTKKSRFNTKRLLEDDEAVLSSSKPQHKFAYMSKEQLLTIARNQSAQLKKYHKQIERLEKNRERMSEVGENTHNDLKCMFEKLNKGLISKRERLENPVCMWKGCCAGRFSDVECLYNHVKEHIPNTDSSIAPVDRLYACFWKECEKTFSKKKLLHNHILEHTGNTHDQFFEILLKDQAKALSMPSRQMRWHPLIIKWCLRMYTKSHSSYDDIRESGFIKLPSGRTLNDYKNFCSPKSGWNTENIKAMKDKFEKLKLKKSAKIGAFLFDEVKIKEGLLFDPSTWELIGFTNLDDSYLDSCGMESSTTNDSEAKLATHVLQFFFKSLFANFDFPCSYFLTKGITAQKLNRIFWQGVSMLHGFQFTILLSICDGASENRAFISMNGTNASKSQGVNRFSGRPIFFFQDPPHLMKKLRNNLFSSGFKEKHSRFTRTLKLNKYILWDHIYSVYEREKKRRLYATPLRRAHVELDNLSKMRVKLAVNTLSNKVAEEMREHENNETQSTQEFICMCHNLWEVFSSRNPITSIPDPRISILDNVLSFFTNWKISLQQEFANSAEVSNHFITWQTMFDLQVTIHALKELLEYLQTDEFKAEFGHDLYLVLNRLNQDCVESFFSVQRQMCGGTQNMTGYIYGYNVTGNISFTSSKLVSRKQTNVFETEQCFTLAANMENLPRRQAGEGIFDKVQWPVNIS